MTDLASMLTSASFTLRSKPSKLLLVDSSWILTLFASPNSSYKLNTSNIEQQIVALHYSLLSFDAEILLSVVEMFGT